jgi:sugar transferase (PEP-CTERM system associated)
MIKIFNHYLHRRTLLQISFDFGLILFAVIGVGVSQADTPNQVVPLAATHGLSLAACLFLINTASGFYQNAHHRSLNQSCARAVLALFLALPLAYGIFSLLPVTVSSRSAMQNAAMLGVCAVMALRVYVSHSAAQSRVRTRILIFGSGKAAALVGETLRQTDPHAEIVGYFAGPNETDPAVPAGLLLAGERSLTETARQLDVDEIVVALTERRGGSMPMRALLDCKLYGIRVFDISTHFEKTLGQIRVNYVNAGWLIFGDGFNQGLARTVIKRIFDILCSALLIVLAAPVMLVTALAIKLESRGPMLYRQERVGLHGQSFRVVKFRSMRTDAEKDGKPRWAAVKDDRVTQVGRFIRLARIDELPQLFNVLSGEMSLVGPRPERPYFVEQLTRDIPYFAVRQSVKPGVTGWAQVRYQYGSTIEDSIEKLQYDLYYVKNHSLFLDMVILFETIAVVLTGKGSR